MSEGAPQATDDQPSVNHDNSVLGSGTYYSTRSSDGESETVQDAAAVFSSLPRHSFI